MTDTIQTQPSADLGWITLGYDDVGTGDMPMILLHGAGAGASSRSNFVANIPVFAEHTRVIALDLPGFGRSDAYVMTTESRQTINCGGHRTPLFGPQPTEGIKALQAVYRDRSLANFRAFFDVMLYDGSTVPDAVLQERADSVRQEQVDAWIESYKSPLRSLAGELQDVRAPTLIMHGRDDRVVAFEGGLALLSEIPGAELHAFNRCGHWVQYEHAETFNELVLSFLARP
jgi:2-hydroxy-6-oxonona-2,4-dienedioate hydrolase